MPRTNPWSRSVPRVELDQRSREARLRLERKERLFVLRAAVTHSRVRRFLCLLSVGVYGGAPQANRIRSPLSNWRPSRMPTILSRPDTAPASAHGAWARTGGAIRRRFNVVGGGVLPRRPRPGKWFTRHSARDHIPHSIMEIGHERLFVGSVIHRAIHTGLDRTGKDRIDPNAP